MKKWSRPLLIGGLMLVFWTSACNLSVQTPQPSGTILPAARSATPTARALIPLTRTSIPKTDTPLVPVIPITGENVVEMQCQFCVNSFAHAVFIFPDAALFDVESSSPVSCLTAEVVNGKRILVCNGAQSTSFNLKICSDASNCLLFPVALQPCPLPGTGTPITTATAMTPVFLSPINTLRSPRSNNSGASPVPTQTSVAPTLATTPIPPSPAPTSVTEPPPANTPVPPPTKAPPPTKEPPPTKAPPPTKVPRPTKPADTPAPTSDGNKKPTKTPKSRP